MILLRYSVLFTFDSYIGTGTLSRRWELIIIYLFMISRDINLYPSFLSLQQKIFCVVNSLLVKIDGGCQLEKWNELSQQLGMDTSTIDRIVSRVSSLVRLFLYKPFPWNCFGSKVNVLYSEQKKQEELKRRRQYASYDNWMKLFITLALSQLQQSRQFME